MISMKRMAVAAALTALASSGWAQEPTGSKKGMTHAQGGMTQSLNKGPTFRSSGVEYRVVGGMRAVHLAAGESSDVALGAAGASASSFVEAKGRFVIFRGGGATPVASAMAVQGTSTLPVVENVRTGGLGVVPGILIVTLKAPSEAEAIARDYHLEMVGNFPGISTAFYRPTAGTDLQAVASNLGEAPNVASVEIEVLEHIATPQ
jgi:hypothetical protein